MYLQCAGEFEEILLAIAVTEDVNQPVKIRNRVLSITAHGSTVKSPSGLRWLGSLELLVQKLSNIWIVAVCVNRVLHSNRLAGCLCVALCPQLPRDNIQFVRKPTDFASARFSTSSSAVHSRILWNSSLSLLSFPLSRSPPPILFMFNFVSYILSLYSSPRRLVSFGASEQAARSFLSSRCSVIFFFFHFPYFGRSIETCRLFQPFTGFAAVSLGVV